MLHHGSRYGEHGRQLWLPALLVMLALLTVMITAGLAGDSGFAGGLLYLHVTGGTKEMLF